MRESHDEVQILTDLNFDLEGIIGVLILLLQMVNERKRWRERERETLDSHNYLFLVQEKGQDL